METRSYEKVDLAPLYVKGKRTYMAVLTALVEIGNGRGHVLAVAEAAQSYRVEATTVDRYCLAYVNSGRW
jgi:hypothetical protein